MQEEKASGEKEAKLSSGDAPNSNYSTFHLRPRRRFHGKVTSLAALKRPSNPNLEWRSSNFIGGAESALSSHEGTRGNEARFHRQRHRASRRRSCGIANAVNASVHVLI